MLKSQGICNELGLRLSVRVLMIEGCGLRVQDDEAEGFWRELVEKEKSFFLVI